MRPRDCAALGWAAELDFTVERVIACNESALIFELIGRRAMGEDPTSVMVRRIDDAALRLLRKHCPAATPVGLWYPESLDALERIDASHVVLTSDAGLDPGALARLNPRVQTLDIFGPAFPACSLDLASAPHVENVTVPWALMDGSGSLPARLRSLAFRDSAPETLTAVPPSPYLERLDVSPARRMTTLDGLDRFPALRQLDVDSARLDDLGALVWASHLESLTFSACRLGDLSAVAHLPRLRHLGLLDCGAIASLEPLAGSPSITSILASGSTRIADADLSPLLEMPSLTSASLASRREYRPSLAEVQRRIGMRGT